MAQAREEGRNTNSKLQFEVTQVHTHKLHNRINGTRQVQIDNSILQFPYRKFKIGSRICTCVNNGTVVVPRIEGHPHFNIDRSNNQYHLYLLNCCAKLDVDILNTYEIPK